MIAVVCALVVALLICPILLFETQAMWSMDSPNAVSWNATLNGSATFGFSVIPVMIIIIVCGVILGIVATFRGYG